MQTYLIASNNQLFVNEQVEKIKKQLNVSPFNLHEITPSPSISIATVRNITAILSRKPYGGGGRLLIIRGVEKATLEAANAMLKLLEEPPPENIIILTCDNINRLLPTIVSRCQIIVDSQGTGGNLTDFEKITSLVKKIILASTGERLLMAGDLAKGKEDTLLFLDSLLFVLEKNLHRKSKDIPLSPVEISSIITKVLAAKRYIERNVNFKATLDILFLGFPKSH
ncbi:hypothetical protein HZB96_00645 [Candidatus Gottesmanbacteria bacterium]|nr:hypothetical protein [Candidatus Gottesmanbacteria bacterium]MBI5451832.1 hypothetical protein [Candidatus Gottesmanbacteria bacterium]